MSSRFPCSATAVSVARDSADDRDAPILGHRLYFPDDGTRAEASPQDRRDGPAGHEAEQQDEAHAEPDVPDVQRDRRQRPAPQDERAVRDDERAPDLHEPLPSPRSGGTSRQAASSPPELVTLICGSGAIPLRRSRPRG